MTNIQFNIAGKTMTFNTSDEQLDDMFNDGRDVTIKFINNTGLDDMTVFNQTMTNKLIDITELAQYNSKQYTSTVTKSSATECEVTYTKH